ncbi:MAG: copper-binding protein [Gammaproteobacteria bacterium]|nr:copper-binding protein [Gammaproteobacteria bacterium]
MKHILISVAAAMICLFALNAPLVAGDQHQAEGVVKKINTDDKKITISHGPIKSMGMDGMTMDFAVYDPAMLDEVQEGHKISFVLEEDKSGNLVIMELEDKGMAKGDMASGEEHSHHHDH